MRKPKNRSELVKMLVGTNMSEAEHEELAQLLIDNPVSIDIDKEEEVSLSKGEMLADKISGIVGSWGFLLTFTLFLIGWIILNGFVLVKSLDPFPFILLNLVLSCLTALQAPIIMMSQNRQAKKDSLRNENDYLVDLKSELILEELHKELEKIKSMEEAILKELEVIRIKNKE